MRIVLIGRGKMGTLIRETAAAAGDEIEAAFGRDDLDQLGKLGKAADVVMDFSRPAALPEIAAYVRRTGTPLLSGTTGYTEAEKERLFALGSAVPVLWSANYSLGVAVLARALRVIAPVLGQDFDIEITETHHNQKADAPSGTAKLLLEAMDPQHRLRPGGQRGQAGEERGGHPRPPGRHGGRDPHRPLLRSRRGAGADPPGRQPPDLCERGPAHGPSAAGTAQRGLRPAKNLVWRVTMNAQEIIDYIASSPKRTPVKIYINLTAPVDFGSAQVFGEGGSRVVFGDWAELAPILEANRERITDLVVENDRRNSGVPLLDLKDLPARIEPGAIIREQVTIGESAVIMMGAILNIGAVVGRRTMIDMGAVLGGRATVGDDCHIGAGAVLAGGHGAAVKRALAGIAAVALQKELAALATTHAALGFSIFCHLSIPLTLRTLPGQAG